MSRRITIRLDDDVYEKLVNESLRRYGTTKAMSKVANELLKRALKGRTKVLELVSSKKIAKTSIKKSASFREEPKPNTVGLGGMGSEYSSSREMKRLLDGLRKKDA